MGNLKRFLCLFSLLGFLLALGASKISYAREEAAVSIRHRIVSTNLCTDEILLRLAARKQIAAVTHFAASEMDSDVSDLAKGVLTTRGSLEEIVSLNPDLVLTESFSRPTNVQMLKRKGIDVVVLSVPENFSEINETLRFVGSFIGAEDRAEDEIQKINQALEKIRKQRFLNKPKVVFYQVGGYVPGRETFENAIIQAAGAQNLAAGAGSGYRHLSLEEIIVEKPDFMIVQSDQINLPSVGRELLFHRAIRVGLPETKLIVMPAGILNCGSPSSILAAQILRQAIEKRYRVPGGEV